MSSFKKMKDYLVLWLPSILFNIALIAIVFKAAEQLGVNTRDCYLICLVWSVFRLSIGEPKHYKKWQLCIIWSIVMFMSLFNLEEIHIVISCICAVFTAYTLSGKADIKEPIITPDDVDLTDISQWKPKGAPSKYQRVFDELEFNPSNPTLSDFEKWLPVHHTEFHLKVYQRIFKERMTYQEASNDLDRDGTRIKEIAENVYSAFVGYLHL